MRVKANPTYCLVVETYFLVVETPTSICKHAIWHDVEVIKLKFDARVHSMFPGATLNLIAKGFVGEEKDKNSENLNENSTCWGSDPLPFSP